MIDLLDIVIVLLLFLAGVFWWKTTQAREHAQRIALTACNREGVQLLDQSVALKSMKIKRSARRGWVLVRYFGFEFSCTGDERREGVVAMIGNRRDYLVMDLPQPLVSVDDDLPPSLH
ncbi:MAG: DUF3301 domain-containing protein [Gammaproteobacteria bacterium]|nr:DUF3301 domain-containing protein [Gammaproteobacteria bacterium]